MSHTDNYFTEQMVYITAVLKMLDQANLPEDSLGGYHIFVELRDGDGAKRGFFSDEISGDSWYYQPEVFGKTE